MKKNALANSSRGLLVAACLTAFHSATFAADVTGPRLNIGTNHNLPATSTNSSIAGGYTNTVNGNYTTIGGGTYNIATNDYVFLGGGSGNTVGGIYSAIAGGWLNEVSSQYSFMGSGQQNTLGYGSDYSVIGGGYVNTLNTNYAVIGGGYYNTSAGWLSVIGGGYINTNNATGGTIGGGVENLVTGSYATIAGGASAMAPLYGQSAHASGGFTNPGGDAQASEYVLRTSTTSTNATELFLDGSSARLTIPSGATWAFNILAAARGSTNSAGYEIKGVIRNNSGTAALVGSAPTTVLGEDVAAWDVVASAGGTNGTLVLKATANTTNTVHWVATVHTTEVK